jgi:hypothetical protein
MLLTVQSPIRPGPVPRRNGTDPQACGKPISNHALETSPRAHSCEEVYPTSLAVLLDDPAIALWASEAAARYHVTSLDALGLLAQALLVGADR